jgi:hypothetical protein
MVPGCEIIDYVLKEAARGFDRNKPVSDNDSSGHNAEKEDEV